MGELAAGTWYLNSVSRGKPFFVQTRWTDILLQMIPLISPRLHQNKPWKSFFPAKSRRHSREKGSPKISFASFLQLNLQEPFLTLGLRALVFAGGERSDGALRCEVVQDYERVLSSNHPECRSRLSPTSAWSGTSCLLSTDGAQLMLPSSLVLPCLERYLSSYLPQARLTGWSTTQRLSCHRIIEP